MGGPIEPYRGGRPARQTSRALDRIDSAKSVERARDQARAELAAGRISDLAKVTRHGLAAGAYIGMEAELAAQLSPWVAQEIASIARTGMGGIRAQIADLADPWA